jgi:hypothetical protein
VRLSRPAFAHVSRKRKINEEAQKQIKETNFTAPNSRMLGSLNVVVATLETSTCGERWPEMVGQLVSVNL